MKLLSCDNLAGLFQKHDQDLKGLVLQLDLQAMLAELASLRIEFENAETNNGTRLHAKLERAYLCRVPSLAPTIAR